MKKVIFLCSILLAFCAKAQEDPKIVRYKTSVILGAGTNFYQGDVCKGCTNLGYQFNLASRIPIYKRFYFRPEVSFQRIQSQIDENSGLSFKNNNYVANLNLEYALTTDLRAIDRRAKNEVFLSFAPVLMHHNPFTTIEGKKTYLAALQTEGVSYSKMILGAKFGLFADFKLNKNARFGLALDYVLLLNDYVDDVSATYIDYTKADKIRTLAIDPSQKAVVGSARGNGKPFDSLLRFSLSYEFSFERRTEVFN